MICIKLLSKLIHFPSAIHTVSHVQVRTYTYRYDHNLQVPWQTPPQVLCGILLESNVEHLLMLAKKLKQINLIIIVYSILFDYMLKCSWNLLAFDTFWSFTDSRWFLFGACAMSGFLFLGGGNGLTCNPDNNDWMPEVFCLNTKVFDGEDVFVSTTL